MCNGTVNAPRVDVLILMANGSLMLDRYQRPLDIGAGFWRRYSDIAIYAGAFSRLDYSRQLHRPMFDWKALYFSIYNYDGI